MKIGAKYGTMNSTNHCKPMKYNQDIRPVTYLKTNSADLIKEVQKNKRPIFVTQNGEAKIVLQDLEEYQRQKDTLLMLKMIALGEREIRSGDVVEQDKLFSKIQKKLDK